MTRLSVNIDTQDCGMRFLNILTTEKPEVKESDLYPFVDQYAEVGVTDLLFCLINQHSTSRSEVIGDSIFKYEQTVENGVPVNYKKQFRGIYSVYKQGVDPFKVWFDRSLELGITPWISLRMNDRHMSRAEVSELRPDFFYKARAMGWMLGEGYPSYSICLNYAVPEVREMWLAYIDEQLGRYNAYGVELDFQREMHCLDYLNDSECHEIMTAFIREVRRILRLHEKRKGHPIKLGVRLMRDLDQSLVFGFDAAAWDREGLVDMITVTPRWETNDSDMPIGEWKARLPHTEIHAGIETLIHCGGESLQASAAAVRGYANRYLSDGADGMYFFNFYPLPNDRSEGERLRAERSAEVFSTCGNPEALKGMPMRYIVTRQDIAPVGFSLYKPLPIKLNGDSEASFNVGRLPKDKRVYLIVGYDRISADGVSLTVNGRRVLPLKEYSPMPEGLRPSSAPLGGCGYVPDGSRTYLYSVDTSESGDYRLLFSAPYGSVTYIEFEM